MSKFELSFCRRLKLEILFQNHYLWSSDASTEMKHRMPQYHWTVLVLRGNRVVHSKSCFSTIEMKASEWFFRVAWTNAMSGNVIIGRFNCASLKIEMCCFLQLQISYPIIGCHVKKNYLKLKIVKLFWAIWQGHVIQSNKWQRPHLQTGCMKKLTSPKVINYFL